jgi:hypothetical protein
MPLDIIAKLPANAVPIRVFDFFTPFAMIKSWTSCVVTNKNGVYLRLAIENNHTASNRKRENGNC